MASAGAPPAAIGLDIEGTVAPSSFVSEARCAPLWLGGSGLAQVCDKTTNLQSSDDYAERIHGCHTALAQSPKDAPGWAQVLFPYAAKRVRQHLEFTYNSEETTADIDLLRKLVGSHDLPS